MTLERLKNTAGRLVGRKSNQRESLSIDSESFERFTSLAERIRMISARTWQVGDLRGHFSSTNLGGDRNLSIVAIYKVAEEGREDLYTIDAEEKKGPDRVRFEGIDSGQLGEPQADEILKFLEESVDKAELIKREQKPHR